MFGSHLRKSTRFTQAMRVFLACSFGTLSLLPGLAHAQQNPRLQPDLFSVSFPTERDGWACGRWGRVLHTSDGGTSWARQDTGTGLTLSSVCFVDRQNGWAVGDRGTIIRTADGGRSWVKQESPVDYFHMDVHFADAETGWIATERTTILHTADGGKNWRIQFRDEDFILKGISFCDPENGWAVGEYGYIYHTSDGGRTWQHQAGEFGYSEATRDIVGGHFLFDVVAVDPETAWAVGIDGHVARTVDGGKTWQAVTDGFPKTQLFGIASDRQGTLVIGGNGTLLISADGGESFHPIRIHPPITYGWVYGIAARGAGRFVAVGKQGWICHDDGRQHTWSRNGDLAISGPASHSSRPYH